MKKRGLSVLQGIGHASRPQAYRRVSSVLQSLECTKGYQAIGVLNIDEGLQRIKGYYPFRLHTGCCDSGNSPNKEGDGWRLCVWVYAEVGCCTLHASQLPILRSGLMSVWAGLALHLHPIPNSGIFNQNACAARGKAVEISAAAWLHARGVSKLLALLHMHKG